MCMHDVVEEYMRSVGAANDGEELAAVLADMTRHMGFARFALTHHAQHPPIRMSNYPEEWVDYFDRNRLGPSDPVHRASHGTGAGFCWSQLSDLIELTAADQQLLERARRHGLTDGFTIPFNIVGEAHGSCSFAVGPGALMPGDALPLAQYAGTIAFEGARRFGTECAGPPDPRPRLTDRQRDCLIWAARGKTAWETARILGISQETVIQHLKQAQRRYGVQKQSSLLIRALFDGTISFADIYAR